MRSAEVRSKRQRAREKRHYIPQINRFLISALYHEAKSRKMPMTKLTEHLLTEGLSGTEGWRAAQESLVREEPPP